MSFVNLQFWALFLPVCFAVYAMARSARGQNLVLLLASLVFYASYDYKYVLLLLLCTGLGYLGGRLRSKSQIRAVDVFGTVAFAQIPLLVVNLLMITPPMQQMAELAIDANNIGQLLADHQLLVMSTLMTLLQIPFVVLMLLWMVMAQAIFRGSCLNMSCNLKSWALVGVYAVGIIGGDILSRIVISYIV